VHRKKPKCEKKVNNSSETNSKKDVNKDSKNASNEESTPSSDFGAAFISIKSKNADNISDAPEGREKEGNQKDGKLKESIFT
jgi:hypothetical protein